MCTRPARTAPRPGFTWAGSNTAVITPSSQLQALLGELATGLLRAYVDKWLPEKRPDGHPWGWGCGDRTLDFLVPDGFLNVSFLAACRKHDQCYGTLGAKKAQCDRNLRSAMMSACANSSQSKELCRQLPELYYTAVTAGGHDSYIRGQQKAEEQAARCSEGSAMAVKSTNRPAQ